MIDTTLKTATLEHAADRLQAAVDRVGAPVCVGLDPVVERLPDAIRSMPTPLGAIEAFSLGVLDAVRGIVPCVKIQSACYERYGAEGVALRDRVVGEARVRELEVILDAKRGDIGISADHYAAGLFACGSDWITVHSYLGRDGIVPFLQGGRGAFALVRTSNPGGDQIQARTLDDGATVAEHVAGMVAEIGRDHLGTSGFSALGAVVGATKASEAGRLRELMPEQFFLVPGFGAQGGTADDVRGCFCPGGRGAVVTASRSVIYASGGGTWTDAVAEAARKFAGTVADAVGAQ